MENTEQNPEKLKLITAFLMLVFLLMDLGSKIWVRINVPLYEATQLLPNFIDLTHVQNKGVSFSFMADFPDMIRLPLLVGIPLIAIAGMLYYLIRYWESIDFYTRSGLTCIIPGAIGNLIDRAYYGYVTDFFHFRWYETGFFVNNIADIFISFGVVFFVIPVIFPSKNTADNSE